MSPEIAARDGLAFHFPPYSAVLFSAQGILNVGRENPPRRPGVVAIESDAPKTPNRFCMGVAPHGLKKNKKLILEKQAQHPTPWS